MLALRLCTKDEIARKKFINIVDKFVTNGAKDFINLKIIEQIEIVGYYLNALDDKTEWLVESLDANKTIQHLIKIMTFSHNYDWSKTDLVHNMQEQAINYFSTTLNEYITEQAAEFHKDKLRGEVNAY